MDGWGSSQGSYHRPMESMRCFTHTEHELLPSLEKLRLRRLGPETFLMTYVLRQGDRLTRRATNWQRTSEDWLILYHQGTVVSVEEDDVSPLASRNSDSP